MQAFMEALRENQQLDAVTVEHSESQFQRVREAQGQRRGQGTRDAQPGQQEAMASGSSYVVH